MESDFVYMGSFKLNGVTFNLYTTSEPHITAYLVPEYVCEDSIPLYEISSNAALAVLNTLQK